MAWEKSRGGLKKERKKNTHLPCVAVQQKNSMGVTIPLQGQIERVTSVQIVVGAGRLVMVEHAKRGPVEIVLERLANLAQTVDIAGSQLGGNL